MLTDPSSALRRLVAWLKVAGLAILLASVVLAAHRHYTVSAPAAPAVATAPAVPASLGNGGDAPAAGSDIAAHFGQAFSLGTKQAPTS